ncbi:MAG TPA: preprotein translocase subunit SecG [Verrucomicrobiae bacterium]|nr:preprotein translocase subunit SecG [Verrucomicrobiae bacterium]
MGFVTGFLTLLMVLDCLVLVLLVLIQLPKKEAGAGLAFGGGASDALFGAGSGNVLTKITKYAAGIFFAMALLIGILQTHTSQQGSSFLKNLSAPAGPAATPAPTASHPAPMTGTNAMPAPGVESTNVPIIPLPPAATTPPAAANPATNATPQK